MLLYWILLPIVWVLAHIIWRFEVIGRENLKAVRDGRAYVIAPNHIANLDPVFIAITVFDWKRLRILAKEELFKNPLAGWFLRCMGAVAIERGKGDTTIVEKLTNECKNGTGIMIFPEGTRGDGHEIAPFHKGLAKLAHLRPDVPIVPVALANLGRILPKGGVIPVPMLATITFLRPIALGEGETEEEFLERARLTLVEALPDPSADAEAELEHEHETLREPAAVKAQNAKAGFILGLRESKHVFRSAVCADNLLLFINFFYRIYSVSQLCRTLKIKPFGGGLHFFR